MTTYANLWLSTATNSQFVAFDPSGPVGLNGNRDPESVVNYLRHILKYIQNNVIPKFEAYV